MTVPTTFDTAVVAPTPLPSLAVVAIVVDVGVQLLPIPQIVSALGAPAFRAGGVVSFGFGGAGGAGAGGITGCTATTGVGVGVAVGVTSVVAVGSGTADCEFAILVVEAVGWPSRPDIPIPKPRTATITSSAMKRNQPRMPERKPLEDAGVPGSPAATLARIASATPVESASGAMRERASRSVSSISATVIPLSQRGGKRFSRPEQLRFYGSGRDTQALGNGLDRLIDQIMQHTDLTLCDRKRHDRRFQINIQHAEHF